jgi:hypothetical protein
VDVTLQRLLSITVGRRSSAMAVADPASSNAPPSSRDRPEALALAAPIHRSGARAARGRLARTLAGYGSSGSGWRLWRGRRSCEFVTEGAGGVEGGAVVEAAGEGRGVGAATGWRGRGHMIRVGAGGCRGRGY